MTEIQKDDIILQAAIEFGPDYLYSIKYGTLGLTLYVEVKDKFEARIIRKAVPPFYEELRTIILYSEREEDK
jgi:hypothetical protein